MVSCGCLFCDYCYNQILKIKNPFCPNCKNQIEQNKSLNLKNPNQAKKISFLFLDPEKEIKKMMKALKYQKIQQKKYINFLENKIEVLLKENNSLKEIIKVS
jgi:predicted amidophosphoribosyltransferase